MRPDLFATTITFSQALARVLEHVVPITRTETVTIAGAGGRVAAADVVADIDVPAFDRALMDGYAVRAGDLATTRPDAPGRLTAAGQFGAGDPLAGRVEPGQCVEIATGARLPEGADAVVMVERTSRDGDIVLVHEPPSAGQHIGRRGADLRAGAAAVHAGDVVTPARAGALSAIGRTALEVYERPVVAIFSSGTEVVSPGRPLGPGQVYDVNTAAVSAVLAAHGGLPRPTAPVGDSVDALADALVAASSADVIVCSGGSSVGRRDLLIDALVRCGRVVFHGIAVKPGKPTLFGYVNDTPLFGMPGNPTSCLSNAYLLLVPFLRATAHLPAWRPHERQLPLARRIASNAGRHQFYTVRIVDDRAEPAFKSSGDITSMANADGYIEIPADVSVVEEGTMVRVVLF